MAGNLEWLMGSNGFEMFHGWWQVYCNGWWLSHGSGDVRKPPIHDGKSAPIGD